MAWRGNPKIAMEIKIQCDCGQRYKLDVEPVEGRMPFTVNCPTCGVDGTEKGTDLIQQALATASGSSSALTPSVPSKLRLSIGKTAREPVAPMVVDPQSAPTPSPLFGSAQVEADAAIATPRLRKPSFGLGLLGGFAGALVGGAVYFLIVKTTGLRISFFAIGVGGLAGWMAELFGKGEGSKELAGITAVFTISAIIAAQYFLALIWWHNLLGADFGKSAYDLGLKQAQMAVKMIPTGSDSEIRNYLVAEETDDDNKPTPSSFSDDDVKQFRDTQLPGMRDLAGGKITREQYNAQNQIDPKKDKENNDQAEGTFKAFFLLLLIRKSVLFSIAAAAALAFRLCANA